MAELAVTFKILKDILEKKKDALKGILAITENQETILKGPPGPEQTAFFDQTSVEKQRLIDNVLELDELFGGFFNTISTEIKDGSGGKISPALIECRKDTLELQELIKQVLELDVQIRAFEQKNNGLRQQGQYALRPQTVLFKNKSKIISELNKHK